MATFISKNGKQLGPFSDEEVLQGIKEGTYSVDDLCSREGWTDWKRLGDVYASQLQQPKKQTVSTFEGGLFGFTRWIIGKAAVGVVILIGLLILVLLKPSGNTEVTFDEVVLGGKPTQVGSPTFLDSFFGGSSPAIVKIPQNVRDEFTGENAKVLNGWIENYPPNQQQEFLDNLSALIDKAQRKGMSSNQINDLENHYRDLKRQKFRAVEVNKYINWGVKGVAVVLIAALVVILCMISLLLVLLAVERNTRPADRS